MKTRTQQLMVVTKIELQDSERRLYEYDDLFDFQTVLLTFP